MKKNSTYLKVEAAIEGSGAYSNPPPSDTITVIDGISEYVFSRRAFRCFMLNKRDVDDWGREINAQGDVIEDDNWEILPGCVHQPWPLATYKKTCSDIILSFEEYQNIKNPNGYIRSGYFLATSKYSNQAVISRENSDVIHQGLVEDIASDPKIALAYLTAAQAGTCTLPKQMVIEAINKAMPSMHISYTKAHIEGRPTTAIGSSY